MSTGGARLPFRGLRRMVGALVRQRRRLALATVAIALGVGYLAGALTLLDRVAGGLDALAAAGAERADLVVEGGVAYESPVEQVRRLVPITTGQAVAAIPGVASASPRIEDTATLIDSTGRPVVPLGLSEQPLGANWPDDPAVAPYRFVSGGPPTGPGDVVIDQRSAEAAKVGVGDKIAVSARAKGLGDYTVTGIIRTDVGGLPAGSSLALFTTAEARALFDRPLDDNSVAVRLAPGADRDEVAGNIRRTLPAGIEVVDGATAAVHRQESLTRSFTLVRSLILGFAGLALVVGMVTVANSLALLYAERRRTFASLRLVGAKPGQLLTAALVEAGMLALFASLIGAPLGLLLGRVIEAALGALNTSIPVAGSIVSWRALGWAVLIGFVATVVAAILPAARACRVPPIEAVTDADVVSSGGLRRPLTTVAIVSVLAAVVAGLLVARGDGGSGAVAAAAAVGGAVAFIGLLPVILSGLVAAGVRIVPLRPRALRRIAARDVVRNRTRTAATAAALILATAVVSGLAVFLASFTASVDGEVRQLVTADLVVDSGTFTKGGLPADLLGQLGDLDQVEAASGWEVGRADIGLTPIRMTGLDLDSLYDVVSPVWVGDAPSKLDESSVLLDARLARKLGVKVGDPVPITFTSQGTEGLRVAGIYDSGGLLLGDAVLDRSVIKRQVPATTDIAALVKLQPDDAASRAAVKRLASSHGISTVLRPDQFVDRRADLLRGFQRVIEWMLLFTLLQALVGVVNTLLLSVGERRREFGLLRASGASRRQILRLVLLEGISLAVVGTAVGLLLGLAGARLGIEALSSLGLDSFVVPTTTVALTAAAALVLGVAAAVAPARWAAGVPPLEAVSDVGGLRSRPRRAQRPRLHRRGKAAFHWEDKVPIGRPALPPAPPEPFVPVPAIASSVAMPPGVPPPADPGVAEVRPIIPVGPAGGGFGPATIQVPFDVARVAPAADPSGDVGDLPPGLITPIDPIVAAAGHAPEEFEVPAAWPVVAPTSLPFLNDETGAVPPPPEWATRAADEVVPAAPPESRAEPPSTPVASPEVPAAAMAFAEPSAVPHVDTEPAPAPSAAQVVAPAPADVAPTPPVQEPVWMPPPTEPAVPRAEPRPAPAAVDEGMPGAEPEPIVWAAAPEPVVQPQPEPVAWAAPPEPVVQPQPEPVAWTAPLETEPVVPSPPPEPVVQPQPQPEPEPEPVVASPPPEPQPEPEPVVQLPPEPQPQPRPQPQPQPEPEPVVQLPPEPEPAPVVLPPQPEPVGSPTASAGTGPFAPDPGLEPDAGAVRRTARTGRLIPSTTRRRRTRGDAGAAEGWLAPDDTATVTSAPEDAATSTFRPGPATDAPGPTRFATPTGGGGPAGATGGGAGGGRGGSGGGDGPGRDAHDPGSRDAAGSASGQGAERINRSLLEALGRLERASIEDGGAALGILGGVLAPGEEVEHIVIGRAKGLVCVVTRTERRVIVVADRAGRPLVESLHPTRTTVQVTAGDRGRVGLTLTDGRRVLRVGEVRDSTEALALAGPGRPDPGYF